MRTLALFLPLVVGMAASKSPAVTEINTNNLHGMLINSDIPVVAKFYSPSCGHCQVLAPKFHAAAKAGPVSTPPLSAAEDASLQASDPIKTPFRWVTVNCQDYSGICDDFGIKGYPVVQFFPAKWQPGMPTHKFKGVRAAAPIRDFASRMIRKPLIHVGVVGQTTLAALGESAAHIGVTAASTAQELAAFTKSWGNDNTTFILAYSANADGNADDNGINTLKAWIDTAVELHDDLTLLAIPRSALPSELSSPSQAANSIIKLKNSGGNVAIQHFSVEQCEVQGIGAPSGGVCDLRAQFGKFLGAFRFDDLTVITADNFSYLVNNKAGAYVAIGMFDPKKLSSDASTKNFFGLLNRSASRAALPGIGRTSLLYAWIDSNLYATFMEEYGVAKEALPGIIVLDIPSQKYWFDAQLEHNEDAWEAFLSKVLTGDAPVNRQGLLAVPQQIANVIGVVPTAALGAVVAALLLWTIWKLVFAELVNPPETPKVVDNTSNSAPSSTKVANKGTQQPKQGNAAPQQAKKSFRDVVPELQSADNSDGELSDGDVDNFLQDDEHGNAPYRDSASESDSEAEVVEGLRRRKRGGAAAAGNNASRRRVKEA